MSQDPQNQNPIEEEVVATEAQESEENVDSISDMNP